MGNWIGVRKESGWGDEFGVEYLNGRRMVGEW